MKKLKVGINGLGRIGRALFRLWATHQKDFNFEITQVNNPGERSIYGHLLQYDSVHGPFLDVSLKEDKLILKTGQEVAFFLESSPENIPWDVDVVIDCTGVFKDKKGLSRHLKNSVKKVIMCAPGKDLDGTFVMGINEKTYNPSLQHIISNASCTTNCLAPLVKILHEAYEIQSGLMNTIHSYTSDQQLLDSAHSDLRRARAAALSMIPTTTGAAKAVAEVMPELKGKLDGLAIRVPTPNVSLVDFTCIVALAPKNKEEVNRLFFEKSKGEFASYLYYSDLPLVSQDFLGSTYSSSFDALSTNVIGHQIKVLSWYDNEIGYSKRVLDLAHYVLSFF